MKVLEVAIGIAAVAYFVALLVGMVSYGWLLP